MYQWEKRLRLVTGLVLAVYVVQHLLNHALGILGFGAMEAWREVVSPVWDHPLPMLALHGSLLTHFLLALLRLYRRRTLQMPAWEFMQLAFGLSIGPLIVSHVIGTRVAALLAGFEPDYEYIASVIAMNPRVAVQLPVLLMVVWIHLIIGLHFWLRLRSWYRRGFPVWVVLAVAVPLLALVGVLRAALTASEWRDDPQRMQRVFSSYDAVGQADRAFLSGLEVPVLLAMLAGLVAVMVARWIRYRLAARGGEIRVSHANGRTVKARRGQTLLEALRAANIPHMSVCGGRARCTTCRVRVGLGREYLPAPDALESAALARIEADETVRLACQTRPMLDVAITPLVDPALRPDRALAAGGVQGSERMVVCMFVDMRESTRMGERILPYDVVFILNQFFSELSDSLESTRGHYAQFSGDGLMALYGIDSEDMAQPARDAINGAAQMYRRLTQLNDRLRPEFGIELRMGVGVHTGPAIVGRMGPPRSPILTAIGDTINIAARLETASKTHACDAIVSAETLELIGFDMAATELEVIEIRGRVNGMRVGMFTEGELSELSERLGGSRRNGNE